MIGEFLPRRPLSHHRCGLTHESAISLLTANSDSKYYWNLTENIYRFIPGRLALMKNPHTVDERIHIDAHIETIKFFYKLAQNSNTWAAP